MGGLLIAIAILVPTLLWADLSNPFVWIAVCSTLAFGAIGFTDDYLKVVHRRNLGLTGRAKLGYQILASIIDRHRADRFAASRRILHPAGCSIY